MAAEKEMWDKLNIEYEKSYQDNPLKKNCVEKAITLLRPGARVLDVGCGTGVPVARMLAEAGLDVEGIDVAPNMVHLAQRSFADIGHRWRIKGVFHVADMMGYKPDGTYAGVFIIYSQLGLSYASFNTAVKRFAKGLEPGGIIVIGQSPADPDKVPANASEWDKTKSYVSGFNLPFMGEPFATLMFTRFGQKQYLKELGLEIVYENVGVFQPKSPKAHSETQQYVIGQKPLFKAVTDE